MNNNPQATSSSAQTITPNTLNAISGVLNSNNANTNGYSANQNGSSQDSATYASASAAASTAANGLFLLSQAHQELTKREEQARAGNGNPNGVNGSVVTQTKRGTKRKSLDAASPPPPPVPSATRGKRTRSTAVNGKVRKASPRSEDMFDDDDDDDDDQGDIEELQHMESVPNGGGRRGAKKPETEEEKRRNFLERNRQG